MPKSQKRKKNSGVGVDFRRVKHKVGKKLPKAQNETDTTVRSGKIVLAEQSVAADKTGQATTQRKNTLHELLGQSRHYSEKVRLKALQGLTELLVEFPAEGTSHASEIVSATADRATDSDQSCRVAYTSFLKRALFPCLGKEALQPFLPLLMGYICSAMTHLSMSVRASGIDMMNVVLEWRPDLVARWYFVEIAQHFLEALSRSSRGRSLNAGSLGALMTTVSGLQVFLRCTFPYFNSETIDAKASFHAADTIMIQQIRPPTVLLNWRRGLHSPNASMRNTIQTNERDELVKSLAEKLVKVLLDCWEECGMTEATVAFSNAGHIKGSRKQASPDECGLVILGCINSVVSTFGPGVLGDPYSKSGVVARVLKQVFARHPSPHRAGDALLEMDVAGAELMASLVGALSLVGEMDIEKVIPGIERLPTWCATCAAEMPTELESNSHSELFSTIIRISSKLLPHLSPKLSSQLLISIYQRWADSPPGSDNQLLGLRLLSDILRPPLIRSIPFKDIGNVSIARSSLNRVQVDGLYDPVLSKWIADIPSLLWSQRNTRSSPKFMKIGLHVLLQASRFVGDQMASYLPLTRLELENMAPKIVPLFVVKIKGKVIEGPLVKSSLELQNLAVDLLGNLPGIHKAVLQMMGICALIPGLLTEATLARMLEVVQNKCQIGDPEEVWGLIYSIIRGTSEAKNAKKYLPKSMDEQWTYHMATVEQITNVALHCSPPDLAMSAILPSLLKEISSFKEVDLQIRARYGALYFFERAWHALTVMDRELPGTTQSTVFDMQECLCDLICITYSEICTQLRCDTLMGRVMKLTSNMTNNHPGCFKYLMERLSKEQQKTSVQGLVVALATSIEDSETEQCVKEIMSVSQELEQALLHHKDRTSQDHPGTLNHQIHQDIQNLLITLRQKIGA